MAQQTATALYDFQGQTTADLSFAEGDTIVVVAQSHEEARHEFYSTFSPWTGFSCRYCCFS